MKTAEGLLLWFFFLGTVLGAALLTVFYTGSIQRATYNVVTYTRQILHTTTTDQHDAVLLEVVTFTRNVSDHLYFIRKTHLRYFTQGGVWLLRSGSINTGTNATALRTCIQRT